jgi:hypothetical protein
MGLQKKLKDNHLEIFKDVVSADTAAAGELDESEEDPDEEAPGNTERSGDDPNAQA